ncbi:hypothetical protein [Caulobacter sp.]|uniref:hypothetical protein n=1 Tax=Caulobacter sp. TaxID=78 RepID=UPI0031D72184
MSASTSQQKLHPRSANELERFASLLAGVTSITPPRTSARQIMAFCMVAMHHIRNQSITLAELTQMGGEDMRGSPILGRSLERTFGLFMEPNRVHPDALSWITQEIDPDDRRRKYLRLSALGVEAVAKILGDA